MKRVAVFFAVGALALSGSDAIAQGWPQRPIQFVVATAPSGGTDAVGRLIAQKLSEALAQNVVVDNRPGASGSIGSALVAKAAPDGYVLLVANVGHIAMNPAIARVPFDTLRDFTPVTMLASGPLILITHPSVPAKNVRELVALAKSKPGKLNYSTGGSGTTSHFGMELFKSVTATDIVHIPFKGSGAAVIDVLSGQVPIYFMNILQSLALIKAGKLRPLGVTSPKRSPIAPDLPAIAEAGIEFDMTNWYGLLVQGSTPRDTVYKLQQEVTRVLNLPELKERLAGEGMTVVASTPEQFVEFLARETAKYNRIIQAAGIKGS